MLKRQLRPLSHRLWTRRAWVASVVVVVLMGAALGEAAGASQTEGKAAAGATATAPATGPATATAPAAASASKDSQPLLEFARQMGAPGWLLSAGTALVALFFLGEPIQKNYKAWRQGLGLKGEPGPSASTTVVPAAVAPPPPSVPQPPVLPKPSSAAPAPSPSQPLTPAGAVAAAAAPLPGPTSAGRPAAGSFTLVLMERCRDNPFGDRGRISNPSRFFDREDLLRDIFVELRKGSSLSLVGESQIGKSSLLAMVKHQGPTALAGTGKKFIMIDMQTIRDEAEFFEALCAELGLGQTLRGLRLKRALQHQQMVVCLDEIEKMTHPQAFSWEQRAELRGLAEGQDAPLSLVIASRSPLSDLFPDNPRETSPLAGLCGPPFRVGPFSEAISGAFLRSRLLGHAVQFTEGQIAGLHEQSQGHPGRLQSMAAELYRQLVR